MTGSIHALARLAIVITTSVLPLARQIVHLWTEKISNSKQNQKQTVVCGTGLHHRVYLKWIRVKNTSALLMNCSVAVFSFSLCPLQALSADACRARPNENVMTQGLARGQLLMALRWTEASSSLWPPERKATPVGNSTYILILLLQTLLHMHVKPSPDETGPWLTWDSRRNSAAQGSDSCHSNLFWAIFGGTAVSRSDHVGF